MSLLHGIITLAGTCAITFAIISGTVRAWTAVTRSLERRRAHERRMAELLETISERLSRQP